MGLFDKLKNVLFEEEVEETVKEENNSSNITKSTMELPKINRKKEKYDVEEETDRELFKSEKTFDFPVFDEEEFEEIAPKATEETIIKPFNMLKEEKEMKTEKPERLEKRADVSYNSPRREYTSTRIVKNEQPQNKTFKPSPVISPVYGILDKNYKKEDVVTRDEMIDKKNEKLDVDSVRKKAFGTLEEDLAKTLNEPVEKFYEEKIEEEKKEQVNDESFEMLNEIDNLLEDTVDVEIDVTKEMEIPSRVSKTNYEELEEQETEIITDETVEDIVEEVPEEVVKEDNINDDVSDDTLENDLFDLIDSMYENKEDEN